MTNILEDVYDVGSELGSGYFGVVYSGRLRTGRTENNATGTGTRREHVAIKIFSITASSRMVENELKVMRLLEPLHIPNVVEIETTHLVNLRLRKSIVLELLNGGNLFDRIIREGKFSESFAANIMRVLFTALESIHRAGVIHRDIKELNIVYKNDAPDSEIVFIDFGLSVICLNENRSFKDDTIVGTPCYISPEILLR